jgi:DNA replication protein DnaD
MLPHVFVHNNVFFVNFLVFQHNDMTPIIHRIKAIFKEARFKYSLCGFYNSDCTGYFVFHLRHGTRIQTITDLLQRPCAITSVAKVLTFPYVSEIYDVCTIKKERCNGYMKTLLNEIIRFFGQNKIWIGTRFTHSHFEQIVNLYTTHGFGNPDITNQTTQNYNLAHPVLKMTYPTNQTTDKIKRTSNELKQRLVMNVSAGFMNYLTY